MKSFYKKNLCGISFRSEDLNEYNFTEVRAGLKLTTRFWLGLFGVTVASLSSIIAVFSAGLIALDYTSLKVYNFGLSEISFLIYVVSITLIINRGFEVFSISIVVILIVISTFITVVFDQSFGMPFLILSLSLSIALAWLGIIVTALSVAFTTIIGGLLCELSALLGASLIATVATLFIIESQLKAMTLIAVSIVIFAGVNVAQKVAKSLPNFAWIREVAVFWTSIGGTSFYGADLTDASFDGADLRHTDFRKANLTCTSFKGVTGLELARFQGTILQEPKVRKLLTTNNGRGEDFTQANLQGANLQGADLREAILVKAQVLDADFSGALLTDACIQDWNINKNTRFQDVDCKRVYLKCSLHGNFLEPKPDSGEFQPGEFEKWITDVRDTIDLIFQNGLNWRAFAFSLTQTAINNEGLGLSVRSIENKGDGIVVAKVGVSLETNKTAIHEEMTNHYYQAVDAIEAKYELVLQAKEGEIQRLQTFYDSQQKFIQGLITGIAETKREVIIKGEGNRVYMMNQAGDIMESNNQNINAGRNVDMSSGNKIIVGGDVTNSNLTLADANSQVSNSIQQLRDISTDTSGELAQILTTLQKSINDEPALSENQKKEALEAVETIAEEAKKPSGERVNKLCSMALNALKGIASAVTDASKLAEIFKTYLPTLTSILGI